MPLCCCARSSGDYLNTRPFLDPLATVQIRSIMSCDNQRAGAASAKHASHRRTTEHIPTTTDGQLVGELRRFASEGLANGRWRRPVLLEGETARDVLMHRCD